MHFPPRLWAHVVPKRLSPTRFIFTITFVIHTNNKIIHVRIIPPSRYNFNLNPLFRDLPGGLERNGRNSAGADKKYRFNTKYVQPPRFSPVPMAHVGASIPPLVVKKLRDKGKRFLTISDNRYLLTTLKNYADWQTVTCPLRNTNSWFSNSNNRLVICEYLILSRNETKPTDRLSYNDPV